MMVLCKLSDMAILQDEVLACFVTFELLLLTAKQALKDSH